MPKRILITGKDSYIGTSFENWMKRYGDEYEVETVSTMNDEWKSADFAKFDVVFHVAGIAHVSFDPKMEELYFKINRDLTVEIAKHAKNSGINQFIFMSSIIVFGAKNVFITSETEPKPDNFYGESKLQADIEIHKLQDDDFNVVSIRPPMIYGRNSKGNFPKLVKLARKTPVFPEYQNKRSMLYIDNLSEFIRWTIDENLNGYFYPQNNEYVCTSDIVKCVADNLNKKVLFVKAFNPVIKLLSKRSGAFNKLFGDLAYDERLSDYPVSGGFAGFEDSLKIVCKD